jgi:hypothetical protein
VKLRDPLFHWLFLLLALLAGLALFAVLVPRLVEFGQYSGYALRYRYQIDYDEGINMHAALLISQGRSPYTPLDPNSFVSAPYPPLYYVLAAIPLRWTGPDFTGGRLISLLAAVGTGVLIGAMVGQGTRKWPAGILCCAFFLAMGPIYVWGPLYKNDFLAIFLTVAGLAVVQFCAGRGRAVYWAAPVFALAAFAKQTALIGPAVAALYLLVSDAHDTPGGLGAWRAWRRAIVLGLLSAAAILLPFFGLDLLLHHNLYLHVITYQQLPWHFGQLVQNLNRLWMIYPYLVVLAVIALVYVLVRRRSRLYSVYLLVTTAAMIISNGYEGANFNHLLDFYPPFLLLIGAMLGDLWETARSPVFPLGREGEGGRGGRSAGAMDTAGSSREVRERLAVRLLLLVALAAWLWQGLHMAPPTSWYRGLPSDEEAAQMARIQQLVESISGPVFSEDVGVLLLAGKEFEYEDPSTFSPMARAGIWDDSVLADKFTRGYFDLVLLEYDITGIDSALRWTDRLFGALKGSYKLLYRDWLYSYVPKR